VEVRVHSGSKRKATALVQKGIGKDIKRVRAELLGPGSTSGLKKLEACFIELLETSVCHDIDINWQKRYYLP